MNEHCPNPSCGQPIPPDQAMPWCLACGARFPESLQLRLPKLQEAKIQAKLAKGGLWVEETCVRCGTHFRTLALRDSLGFLERECPNCHQVMVSPLSGSQRFVYWLFFGLLTASFARGFGETDLLSRETFYAFLLIVILTCGIYKDLEIVYRQWSSRRDKDNQTPDEAPGHEGARSAWGDDSAPSLVSRWKVGFLILLASWFMVLFFGGIPELMIEIFHRGEADASNLLLGLTWGACVILCPLIISAVTENKVKLAQLWTSWLGGVKTFLVGCLVVVPSVLLYLASQVMKPFVVAEQGLRGENGVALLVVLTSIALGPFWVASLFRWLSRSPLADRIAWFNERWSRGH